MRLSEIIGESEQTPFFKAWFHAQTGRVVSMSFFDKHVQIARKNRRKMGLADDAEEWAIAAVENGWVRISSAKETSYAAEHGYVTARSFSDARAALRWMSTEGVLPPTMDIETYRDGKSDKFFTAEGDDLHRFMDRGIVPRRTMSLNEITEGLAHDGDAYFDLTYAKDMSDNPLSRTTLVYMSPDDYLKVAQAGFSQGKTDRVAAVLERGEKFRETPMLQFAHDGNGNAYVVGHEGRHRARAMKALGVQQMPVLLHSMESGKGKGIRWGVRNNQKREFDYIPVMPSVLHGEDRRGSVSFPQSVIYP